MRFYEFVILDNAEIRVIFSDGVVKLRYTRLSFLQTRQVKKSESGITDKGLDLPTSFKIVSLGEVISGVYVTRSRINDCEVVLSTKEDCILIKKECDMVEYNIAVDDFGSLKAFDEHDQAVQFSTLWQKGPAVLVFVRHFG